MNDISPDVRLLATQGGSDAAELEKLTAKDGREGQHSIRVNDQYRICFKWSSGGADHVELIDYHD